MTNFSCPFGVPVAAAKGDLGSFCLFQSSGACPSQVPEEEKLALVSFLVECWQEAGCSPVYSLVIS